MASFKQYLATAISSPQPRLIIDLPPFQDKARLIPPNIPRIITTDSTIYNIRDHPEAKTIVISDLLASQLYHFRYLYSGPACLHIADIQKQNTNLPPSTYAFFLINDRQLFTVDLLTGRFFLEPVYLGNIDRVFGMFIGLNSPELPQVLKIVYSQDGRGVSIYQHNVQEWQMHRWIGPTLKRLIDPEEKYEEVSIILKNVLGYVIHSDYRLSLIDLATGARIRHAPIYVEPGTKVRSGMRIREIQTEGKVTFLLSFFRNDSTLIRLLKVSFKYSDQDCSQRFIYLDQFVKGTVAEEVQVEQLMTISVGQKEDFVKDVLFTKKGIMVAYRLRYIAFVCARYFEFSKLMEPLEVELLESELRFQQKQDKLYHGESRMVDRLLLPDRFPVIMHPPISDVLSYSDGRLLDEIKLRTTDWEKRYEFVGMVSMGLPSPVICMVREQGLGVLMPISKPEYFYYLNFVLPVHTQVSQAGPLAKESSIVQSFESMSFFQKESRDSYEVNLVGPHDNIDHLLFRNHDQNSDLQKLYQDTLTMVKSLASESYPMLQQVQVSTNAIVKNVFACMCRSFIKRITHVLFKTYGYSKQDLTYNDKAILSIMAMLNWEIQNATEIYKNYKAQTDQISLDLLTVFLREAGPRYLSLVNLNSQGEMNKLISLVLNGSMSFTAKLSQNQLPNDSLICRNVLFNFMLSECEKNNSTRMRQQLQDIALSRYTPSSQTLLRALILLGHEKEFNCRVIELLSLGFEPSFLKSVFKSKQSSLQQIICLDDIKYMRISYLIDSIRRPMSYATLANGDSLNKLASIVQKNIRQAEQLLESRFNNIKQGLVRITQMNPETISDSLVEFYQQAKKLEDQFKDTTLERKANLLKYIALCETLQRLYVSQNNQIVTPSEILKLLEFIKEALNTCLESHPQLKKNKMRREEVETMLIKGHEVLLQGSKVINNKLCQLLQYATDYMIKTRKTEYSWNKLPEILVPRIVEDLADPAKVSSSKCLELLREFFGQTTIANEASRYSRKVEQYFRSKAHGEAMMVKTAEGVNLLHQKLIDLMRATEGRKAQKKSVY